MGMTCFFFPSNFEQFIIESYAVIAKVMLFKILSKFCNSETVSRPLL